MTLDLYLKLLSDATFGRGDGVAGLVDAEVEHDGYGLPFLRGRTLKGLLVEECSNILFSLRGHPKQDDIEKAARWLFGVAGSGTDAAAMMRVGAAQLPEDLRRAVEISVKRGELEAVDVLESLTAIRRQTAVDAATGAPDEGSLRSMRTILRDTTFVASLDFLDQPNEAQLALLAACVKAFRRAGTGRNRGRGRLEARLKDEAYMQKYLETFKAFVHGVNA